MGRILVSIKKLKEADNPIHPNNIEEGYEKREGMDEGFFKKPTIGERFYVGYSFSTSAVQEILSEDTFRTYNSIYKYKTEKK